jgi:ribosomal protein L37AE/L43A
MSVIYKCPICGNKVYEVEGFGKYKCSGCSHYFYLETYSVNKGKPIYTYKAVLEEWPPNYEVS